MNSLLLSWDISTLRLLYEARSIPLTYFFIGVTELGSTLTIGGLTAIFFILFAWNSRLDYAAGIAVSVGSAAAVVWYLKHTVALARPDVYYQAYIESGMSFPSGHAAGSFALYGFLAYVASRQLNRRSAIAARLICVVLIGLIGFSRLFLGVHYLSDVLAGYCIGALCMLIAILIARATRHWH